MARPAFIFREYRTTAILAGGKSLRFGSNKAIAPWKSGTVISDIVGKARLVSDEVCIIANDPRPYAGLKTSVFPDVISGAGPLAGIQSALLNAGANRVFVLGCDMPLLRQDVMDWMWSIETWAPAVIPLSPKGLEPLHAIYHKSLLPVIDILLRQGRFAIRSLLGLIPCRLVEPSLLMNFSSDLSFLENANTPEILKSLRGKTGV